MTTAIVADDHSLFREGVCQTLAEAGIEVIGTAGDGVEAVDLARRLHPDIVVMDLHMAEGDGVTATRALASDTNILVLTVSDDDDDLFAALEAGARGYLLKDAEPAALIRAVESVAEGNSVLSPQISEKVFGAVRRPDKDLGKLSAREREVLVLIAQGLSNSAIAQKLGISEHTVKTYNERLYEKLGVSSRSEAAAYGADLSRGNEKDPS